MADDETADDNSGTKIRVHQRSDRRIARILDLIDEAARPRPLPEVLSALCGEVAAIIEADVSSLYVRDRNDMLCLRANFGFSPDAVDQVQLQIGEGITGFAAECMRPVTLSVAREDEHFKAIDGLDEEGYPVFMAIPILVGRRSEAVLVLQRRQDRAFSDPSVVLATALASSFAYALERARDHRDENDEGPRHARLRGKGLSPGVALGRVETAPTFEGLAGLERRHLDHSENSAREQRALVEQGLGTLIKDLLRTRDELSPLLGSKAQAQLASLFLLWEDQRFAEAVKSAGSDQDNPALIMRSVAQMYAKPLFDGISRAADKAMVGRAHEAEALCLQTAARSMNQRYPSQGSVLLHTDRLPAISVLMAIRQRVSAIALGGAVAEDDLALALARAAELPLISEVGGLFAWARGGDRILVNAAEGTLHVNPSASAVARYRSGRP